MKNFSIIGLALLLIIEVAFAQCSGASQTRATLQWSKPAKIVAPDRFWVVEVNPVLDADENKTPVIIRKCGESKSWPLFTLQRSANLYWSSDSKRLLVVNQPLSGTNKLLIFSVPSPINRGLESPSDALDKMVYSTLLERLGKNKHIQFYLPTFVSWTNNNLLLAVGGAAYAEDTGPLDAYCYGLRINSDTLHVDKVLSEKELTASTGHGCQVSP